MSLQYEGKRGSPLLLGFNGPATEAEPSNHYNERERDSHTQRGGEEGKVGEKSQRRDGEEDSGATEAEGMRGGGKGKGGLRRWEKWRETREIPLLPFDLLGRYSSERRSAGKWKTRGRHQWRRVEKREGICIFFVPISHLFLFGFLPVLAALCHAPH